MLAIIKKEPYEPYLGSLREPEVSSVEIEEAYRAALIAPKVIHLRNYCQKFLTKEMRDKDVIA